MSVRVLLCLIVCAGEPTGSNEKVTQIALGNDVSLNCSCDTAEICWKEPQFSNTVRVKFKTTEYLLIKNFRNQDRGTYVCSSGMYRHSLNLEEKYGSSSDEAVLFRASEGDSVFLFCKDLISSTIQATWFWRSHSNHSFNLLSNSAAHIQNRLQYSNKNNDYSLSISNIQWDDSGRYECRRSSEPKQTFFELVVVRVRAEPQQLTEGDNVKLHCDVSYRIPHIKLYWINKETQKNFQNPHQLGNVNMGQRNWTCAVFTGSTLKALIPLTLKITLRPTTTTTSSSTLTPHCHTSDESKTQLQTYSPRTTRGTDSQGAIHHQNNTILIITGFSLILVVVLAGVCWRKRTKKNLEAEGPTCVQDSITYAAVSFRQKSENSKIVEDPCLRDSVTYAEVSFRQKSGDVSSECEPVSNDDPADTEVLYSSVNFKA